MTYRETVATPAPLPLSHLTMTDRFKLYDRSLESFGYAVTAGLAEWALSVGLIGAAKTPVISIREDGAS